jgi:hypothetical protein
MLRIKLALVAGSTALLVAGCGSSHKSATTTTIAAAAETTVPASTTLGATTALPSATGVLSGAWSGRYFGKDTGSFELHWVQSGSTLSGTIQLSSPPVTLSINGTVRGDAIQFGTVGSVGITYSGQVTGMSMFGNYRVGGATGGPWGASKS